MRTVLVIVALLSLASAAAYMLLFGPKSDYVQSSCEIDNLHYAYIGMTKVSEVGRPGAPEYSVQFDPDGVLMRFPPSYYSLSWKDVDAIFVEFYGASSTSGLLKIHVRNSIFTSDANGVERVGKIHRDCWERVKKYIDEHVATDVQSGVRIYEVNAH